MLRPSLHDLESLVALSAETLCSTKANPSPGTQYQQSTQDSFSHSDSPSPLPQPILPSNNTSSTAASMQMDQLSTDESCLESLSVLSGLTTAGNTGTCTLQQQLSHLEPLQPIDIVQETPQQHLSHDMELTKSSLVLPSLSPLTTPLPQLQVPAVASPPITTNFITAAGSNHTDTHNILSSGFSLSPSFSNTEGGAKSKMHTHVDWSRQARKKRQLEAAGAEPSQSSITDYFIIADKPSQLVNENQKLLKILWLVKSDSAGSSSSALVTPLLHHLMQNAQQNTGKKNKQRRHSLVLKKFATLLYIFSGSMAYEFIQSNMPEALPSLKSVQNIVHHHYAKVEEGIYRYDDLVVHLKNF